MSKVFPPAANRLPLQIALVAIVLGGLVTAGVTYYFTPKYTRVGYAPVQPVPFSHALHTGQLGLDCRYCHTGVDQGPHSTVPAAQTCMNCHSIIKKDSPLLAPVRASFDSGDPVPWMKIHQAPDFVYFNHAVHVARGVSCIECHGNLTTTAEGETIAQRQPLSMSFCLDCHRDPASRIRNPKDVFDLNSQRLAEQGKAEEAARLIAHMKVNPPQSCSGCHR
ncbi:MAG TPA: cytochrome c3 family protein [Opitutaceae bacterium]|nr:cytochrome c3 family protein [Opitutaceae bacterium]